MKVLRFVGMRGCPDEAYQTGLVTPDAAMIDTLTDKANVTVRCELNGKPVQLLLNAEVRDLLDFAVTIYTSDEFVPRCNSPDGWTRSFEITFPVRAPSRWIAAESLLKDTLNTLSGDEFLFSWPQFGGLSLLGSHRRTVPWGFDYVCLFSGGVDSLLGAAKLLREGRRLLLVGHQADGATAAAQTALAYELGRLYPGAVRLIQFRVARARREIPLYRLPEKCEDTHRTRSFLFLCLGLAVASSTGIGRVIMPENGLIAINPPLQISRIGTLSTRTAHPTFLLKFIDFHRQLGAHLVDIKNPFICESKTDMLRGLDQSLHPLVQRSISCARPMRYQDHGVRHCGYCVPCIYRRIAMMEVGLDRSSDYAFDVFEELPYMTNHTRVDFGALVGFAKRVIQSSPAERQMLVLSHGAFSPEVASILGFTRATDYSPWESMFLRWAEDFMEKVTDLSSQGTKELLGIN